MYCKMGRSSRFSLDSFLLATQKCWSVSHGIVIVSCKTTFTKPLHFVLWGQLKLFNEKIKFHSWNNFLFESLGSFYTKYPIHRKLISINKIYTGRENNEYNLRHDWNSLLSDDNRMLFKHFSREMFPPADVMVKWVSDVTPFYQHISDFNTFIWV